MDFKLGILPTAESEPNMGVSSEYHLLSTDYRARMSTSSKCSSKASEAKFDHSNSSNKNSLVLEPIGGDHAIDDWKDSTGANRSRDTSEENSKPEDAN